MPTRTATVTNLMGRALGRSPLVCDFAPATITADGHLSIAFTRNPAAADVTFTVLASDDLSTWTPIARSTGGAATANLGGAWSVSEDAAAVRNVTVVDGAAVSTASRRFLRLQINQL